MKTHTFKYNIGDEVMVSDPFGQFFIKAVIVQQIKPFDYPEGKLDSKHLVLFPSTRKEIRPTRSISYLAKFEDTENKEKFIFFWATEKCIAVAVAVA